MKKTGGRLIRILLLVVILLLIAVAGLAVWLLVERTDHVVSNWLATAAFCFVIGFVSILILRVIFFAFFAMIHLLFYRRKLAVDDASN